MGSGSYNAAIRGVSASGDTIYGRSDAKVDSFFSSTPKERIFKQKNINNAMNPHGINIRESRDSKEHPKSLAIVIALDVTGSMGTVPYHLIKEGLPNIMGRIIESGIQDPQVLFLGIGDHECDRSPLQVGQFESSDQLLDKWLTEIYLEGGGGGNDGESYLLAWYLAGKHTSIDCFEKRNEKGFLFTIGDEPCLRNLSKDRIEQIMGPGQYGDFTATELLEKAKKMYNVFHVHINETLTGARKETVAGWKQIMGESLIIAENHEDVAGLIAKTINGSSASKSKVKKVEQNKDEIIL